MSASRDNVATMLSLLRSAYVSGYMTADSSLSVYELRVANAESAAADYVHAREQDERHPLAELIRLITEVPELVEALKDLVSVSDEGDGSAFTNAQALLKRISP